MNRGNVIGAIYRHGNILGDRAVKGVGHGNGESLGEALSDIEAANIAIGNRVSPADDAAAVIGGIIVYRWRERAQKPAALAGRARLGNRNRDPIIL